MHQVQCDALIRLWADTGLSVTDIAERLGCTRGQVQWQRIAMGLPPRENPIFMKKISRFGTVQVFYFKLPISKGLRKLLNRSDTLIEWVDEGRDNYELARAFHVPMGDVVRAVTTLQLVRPGEEDAEPETTRERSCVACFEKFHATKYRFRCDPCLGAHARLDDSECSLGVR